MSLEKVHTLISEEELQKRIKEVAEEINRDYAGKSIHLIGILKGSVFYIVDLAKHLNCTVTMDFMSVSSYANASKSSGVVRLIKDLDEPIEGRDVLVVEDIIDSGYTLSYLLDNLGKRNPKSLKLTTLLDKPDRRVVKGVDVDYVGFVIPDEFVVGYGLDYQQEYRDLPYIGYFKKEDLVS